MIKKYLLGMFVLFVGFIGFSFADNYNVVVIDLPGNFYTNNINNYISPALNFENTDGDQVTHNWLYYQFGTNGSTARKYTFWNNGKLYFYADINETNTLYQGFYDKVCKAYNDTTGFAYCSSDWLDASVFYNLTGYNFTKARVYPAGGNLNLCFYNDNDKYSYCFDASLLTGTLNIPDNTIDISQYVNHSPFKSGNPIIIVNEQCPTIKQIMNAMGTNYNTGLCYNNTLYFNGTNMETIDKQDIFTNFNNDYDNYVNWISIYRNNCGSTATQQACQNAFSGEYKKYSIISNAINSNVDEKKLRNYCNMGLNFDPNATTCVASGINKEEYTPEERLDRIINGINEIPVVRKNQQNGTGGTGGNNSVFNALGDEYINENVRDIFGSLKSIYEKLTGLFKERKNVNGIIPDYILWITFVTLLFTVIYKK